MEANRPSFETKLLEQLLRRLRIVVDHHRYHQQSVDAREVVALVLAEHDRRHRDRMEQYRAVLGEAVRSLIYGLR